MNINKLNEGQTYKDMIDPRVTLEFTGEFKEVTNMYEASLRPIFNKIWDKGKDYELRFNHVAMSRSYVEDYVYDPLYTFKKDDIEDWTLAMKIMNHGLIVQVDEDFYYEMLNVVPPRIQQTNYFEVGEADSHDNHGRPVYKCFWKSNGKFYGARTNSKFLRNTKKSI